MARMWHSKPRPRLVSPVFLPELPLKHPLLIPHAINLQRYQRNDQQEQPRLSEVQKHSSDSQTAENINRVPNPGIKPGSDERLRLGAHRKRPAKLDAR